MDIELLKQIISQAGYKLEGKMYVHHTIKSAFPVSAIQPSTNYEEAEYWKKRCEVAERLMVDYDPLYPNGMKADFEKWQSLKTLK